MLEIKVESWRGIGSQILWKNQERRYRKTRRSLVKKASRIFCGSLLKIQWWRSGSGLGSWNRWFLTNCCSGILFYICQWNIRWLKEWLLVWTLFEDGWNERHWKQFTSFRGWSWWRFLFTQFKWRIYLLLCYRGCKAGEVDFWWFLFIFNLSNRWRRCIQMNINLLISTQKWPSNPQIDKRQQQIEESI